jgi:hypothetical protein
MMQPACEGGWFAMLYRCAPPPPPSIEAGEEDEVRAGGGGGGGEGEGSKQRTVSSGLLEF